MTILSDTAWWQRGIIYEIYPRSFLDSNGDGVGDLEGLRRQLDYLIWLGVDAIWITPIYQSPMADGGYDISDYLAIDPIFGTLADFDGLLTEAHARGLKLILDFVPITPRTNIRGSRRAVRRATIPDVTGTSGGILRQMVVHRITGWPILAAAPGSLTLSPVSTFSMPSSRNSLTSTGVAQTCEARCLMCCASGWSAALMVFGSMCCGY